jgi:hypothetical protein
MSFFLDKLIFNTSYTSEKTFFAMTPGGFLEGVWYT